METLFNGTLALAGRDQETKLYKPPLLFYSLIEFNLFIKAKFHKNSRLLRNIMNSSRRSSFFDFQQAFLESNNSIQFGFGKLASRGLVRSAPPTA